MFIELLLTLCDFTYGFYSNYKSHKKAKTLCSSPLNRLTCKYFFESKEIVSKSNTFSMYSKLAVFSIFLQAITIRFVSRQLSWICAAWYVGGKFIRPTHSALLFSALASSWLMFISLMALWDYKRSIKLNEVHIHGNNVFFLLFL